MNNEDLVAKPFVDVVDLGQGVLSVEVGKPRAGYKIAYFRLIDKKLLSDRPTDSRMESGLTLEIGLIPEDVVIEESGEGCFQVPAGALKTIQMQVGNKWSFPIPVGVAGRLKDV